MGIWVQVLDLSRPQQGGQGSPDIPKADWLVKMDELRFRHFAQGLVLVPRTVNQIIDARI